MAHRLKRPQDDFFDKHSISLENSLRAFKNQFLRSKAVKEISRNYKQNSTYVNEKSSPTYQLSILLITAI